MPAPVGPVPRGRPSGQWAQGWLGLPSTCVCRGACCVFCPGFSFSFIVVKFRCVGFSHPAKMCAARSLSLNWFNELVPPPTHVSRSGGIGGSQGLYVNPLEARGAPSLRRGSPAVCLSGTPGVSVPSEHGPPPRPQVLDPARHSVWSHAWGWAPVPFLRAAIVLREQLLPTGDVLACLPEPQALTILGPPAQPPPAPHHCPLLGLPEAVGRGHLRATSGLCCQCSQLPAGGLCGWPAPRSSVSICASVEGCQSAL